MLGNNWTRDLGEALRRRWLVRLHRRFEDGPVQGYILDVGPKFFVMALVSDRLRLDGFECFRVDDLTKLGPDPHSAFAEAALGKRGLVPDWTPPVSVASTRQLVVSAGQAFPLVSLHREQSDPGVCHIGRVVHVDDLRVALLEIDADAEWDEEPTVYKLNELTRVSFGGDYEDALAAVGGEPPFHGASWGTGSETG